MRKAASVGGLFIFRVEQRWRACIRLRRDLCILPRRRFRGIHVAEHENERAAGPSAFGLG